MPSPASPAIDPRRQLAAAAARPAGGFGQITALLANMGQRDQDVTRSQRRLFWPVRVILFLETDVHMHYTRLLMETEARMSREAWGKSMDASDLARAEVMSLRTTVHAQMSEITELQSADRSRRRAISDLLLRAANPLHGQVMALQGQVTALQGQQGPVRVLAQSRADPEEAGSKMAPKRATRSTPVTTTPAPTAATTTTVTNAQLQAMIDQGVSAALAARDATRNGVDSHTSGTGVRGSERVARECTY
ncbi:hypothetical protein Tco_0686031 [Tanacetum coccineum]